MFLPVYERFYQLKELVIEGDEPSNHAESAPHIFGLLRGKDHAYHRLGASFQHVLPLFVEAGNNRVVFLERHQQRRQRDRVVAAVLAKVIVRG